MFNFLFARPLATLLTVVGVAVLAPVIFPIAGLIFKPMVRPVTNLYLELADEMAVAIEEREKLRRPKKPTGEAVCPPTPEEKAAQKLAKKEMAVEKKAAEAIIKGVAEII